MVRFDSPRGFHDLESDQENSRIHQRVAEPRAEEGTTPVIEPRPSDRWVALAPLAGSFPLGDGAGVDWLAVEEAVEFLGEGGGGGEAAGRIFLQALQAERVEVGGDLAVELRRRRRVVVDDLFAQSAVADRVASERSLAGE